MVDSTTGSIQEPLWDSLLRFSPLQKFDFVDTADGNQNPHFQYDHLVGNRPNSCLYLSHDLIILKDDLYLVAIPVPQF